MPAITPQHVPLLFRCLWLKTPMTLSLLPYVMGDTKNAALEHLLDRDDMLKLLRSNLQKAQNRTRD
ncbi:hypothetical protein HanIR_Chr05g0228741 [Helianthus annuus]|nr:hypothetical protein HanIR_Chr05g0228741 [Helianthus annuus]